MKVSTLSLRSLAQAPYLRCYAEALEIAGAQGREIYVDLDVDVCDRPSPQLVPHLTWWN